MPLRKLRQLYKSQETFPQTHKNRTPKHRLGNKALDLPSSQKNATFTTWFDKGSTFPHDKKLIVITLCTWANFQTQKQFDELEQSSEMSNV